MTDKAKPPPVAVWTSEPLNPEVRTALRRLSQADDIRRIAVMPDVHMASDVCNGIALATKDLIYPQAVGGDIGCGMLAAAFHGERELLTPETAESILQKFCRWIPDNRHSSETMPACLPEELVKRPLSDSHLDRWKLRDGRVQLGSLGRGNHFVELQVDEKDCVWIMIHSGSRGMGQTITRHHLRKSARHGPGGLLALDSRTDAGQAYLQDVDWAILYAEENRRWMLAAAAKVLTEQLGYQLDAESVIHCHHNHVRQEHHDDETVWVHRKGAMPANDGLPGVIPGSMGTGSFHVTGRGSEKSLQSCSHGAGRRLSRTAARRRISPREFQSQMRSVVVRPDLAASLIEEAPDAYQDIHAVMRAQRDLTRIVRELRPILVHKGR